MGLHAHLTLCRLQSHNHRRRKRTEEAQAAPGGGASAGGGPQQGGGAAGHLQTGLLHMTQLQAGGIGLPDLSHLLSMPGMQDLLATLVDPNLMATMNGLKPGATPHARAMRRLWDAVRRLPVHGLLCGAGAAARPSSCTPRRACCAMYLCALGRPTPVRSDSPLPAALSRS